MNKIRPPSFLGRKNALGFATFKNCAKRIQSEVAEAANGTSEFLKKAKASYESMDLAFRSLKEMMKNVV